MTVGSPNTAVQNGRATTSIPRGTVIDMRRRHAALPEGKLDVRSPVHYRDDIATPVIVTFTLIVHSPASQDLRLTPNP